MSDDYETAPGIIRELARQAQGARLVSSPDGRVFLAHAPDVVLKDVTDPHGLIRQAPHRIVANVTVQTVKSLVDYANRYKNEHSLILADITTNTIRVALDYHAPDAPQHLQHGAKLVLPYSEEWKTWTAASGKMVDQLAFARFIEENAADIVAPEAADLLEAVRDLHAVRRVNFTKAVRTNTDNERFEYTDETEARTRDGLELPTKFKLQIPVYFDGREVTVFAFLRWKLDEGKLLLGVVLHRPEHVRQAVFKEAVDYVVQGAELLDVYGTVNG